MFAGLIAIAAAYGLYWLVRPEYAPETAVEMGRKWCAWVLLFVTIYPSLQLLLRPSIDTVAMLVVSAVMFGGLGFLLGLAYGKFKFGDTPAPLEFKSPKYGFMDKDK